MLLRRFTDFILQGRLQAMGTVFACAFVPVVSTVTILIAALVTLRKGVQEGALVLFAATLPILLWYAASQGSDQSGTGLSTYDIVMIVLVSNILTWAFAVLLRIYSSWSLVLQVAALGCILVVCAVHFMYPDVQNWWQTQLTDYFVNTMQAMGQAKTDDAHLEKMAIINMASAVKPYATGLVVGILTFNALLQLLLARWWQAAIFNPGGLRKELYAIRMGHLFGVLFVIGLLASYWGNEVVVDAMPILYLTFGLTGFSLLHSLVYSVKSGWFWLALVYLAIAIYPVCVVFVAFVALLDTWLDFRKRLQKQG